MKRSEINEAIRCAKRAFELAGWVLPPNPRWDITDFGLGNFRQSGLVLVNLCEEPEYCEKLMFCQQDQYVPMHTHKRKKEDIISRKGRLTLEVWPDVPEEAGRGNPVPLRRNGADFIASAGVPFTLEAGERVTLVPGIYHAFWTECADGCVIGEVSTANDDVNDNFFVDQRIGRFPAIDEDEPPIVRLVGETSSPTTT